MDILGAIVLSILGIGLFGTFGYCAIIETRARADALKRTKIIIKKDKN